MAKRQAPRNQPPVKNEITQENIDETLEEIRRNGATEDVIESVKKALANYVKPTNDEAVIKDALQNRPYVDDLSDGDGTDEYDASGEPVAKRKRLADDDRDAGPSRASTSIKKRVKGETKRKRETSKRKHGKDEPRTRVITPPIRNIGSDRKTYFRIMEETAKDNAKIQEMWKKFGPLIQRAKTVIAKENF